MKIRDLLVIIFTAIVALVVLGRAARADDSCPGDGAGGATQGSTSSTSTGGEDTTSSTGAGWIFPIGLEDWMCADRCADACGDRCRSACANSNDPVCVLLCYPACAENCYDDCLGTGSEDPPVRIDLDPLLPPPEVDAGAPPGSEFPKIARVPAPSAQPTPSSGCSASPGAATFTLLNGAGWLAAIGIVTRRRRRR